MTETEAGRLSLLINKESVSLKDKDSEATMCIGVQGRVLHAHLAEEHNHLVVVTRKGLFVFECSHNTWHLTHRESVPTGVTAIRWAEGMNPKFVLVYDKSRDVTYERADKWKKS